MVELRLKMSNTGNIRISWISHRQHGQQECGAAARRRGARYHILSSAEQARAYGIRA